MKYFFHAFFFYAALCAALPVLAGEMPRDSYYFMLDDGIQTPEEMDEESFVVFEKCNSNMHHKLYFNCECMAGTFRNMREKDGPMRPQEDIVYEMITKAPAECVNKPEIAGDAYEECLSYAKTFRELEKDNEQYCGCVGREVARSFSRKPQILMSNLTQMNADALLDCQERDGEDNPVSRAR